MALWVLNAHLQAPQRVR